MKVHEIFVLIHSPLVGELTWTPVADEMKRRGLHVVVPLLKDTPDSKDPFWKQHTDSVSLSLANIPKDQSVILVGHSGAGPLLPVIAQELARPINAYVFVDAGIPRNNATRLDLMKLEDPLWAIQFEESLKRGEQFPNWSSDDLHEIIPDENLRKQLITEIHPRSLDFFTEPIPVFNEWPDARCMYIQFSTPYEKPATYAMQAGWLTHELKTGHFHMLVDAEAVTDLIINATQ